MLVFFFFFFLWEREEEEKRVEVLEKDLLDTTPMRFAIGTATEVRTALLFSSAMLLQYHTSVFDFCE
jgi:hypothetical protein